MTPEQKKALIDGEWDNPQLVKAGPLFTGFQDSVQEILNYTPKTYNHAYSLGFEIKTSSTPDGSDISQSTMEAAIIDRIEDLIQNNELLEIVEG